MIAKIDGIFSKILNQYNNLYLHFKQNIGTNERDSL